jgi:uncharacterized phosphosugar-binding protein
MSQAGTTYFKALVGLLEQIHQDEQANIARGAQLMTQALAEDRLIHVIGTGGHSVIGAEEMFYRAGSLAAVNAILDPGFLLANGALRSTMVERTPGYVISALRDNNLTRGDVLIIVNAYGINSATIDSALWSRENGVHTIAVTSVELQKALPQGHPSRHPSGQNLCDLADVVIDNKIPMGDALIEVDGVNQRMGPGSTSANALCLHLMVLQTVENMLAQGLTPPIWQSSNSPGGDAANVGILERYRPRVKRL